MKIKFVRNGKTTTVDDSYGARLIEHGQAVLAKEEPAMNEPVIPTQTEAEKPKSGKRKA